MANIRFEIFRNRKKFNIINWLRKSKDKSYESFVAFLDDKGVVSPDKEYFKKAIDLLDSLDKREKSFQESKDVKLQDKQEVDIEKKETVPIKVEVVLPKVEETSTEIEKTKTKSVSRKKSRKKSENES